MPIIPIIFAQSKCTDQRIRGFCHGLASFSRLGCCGHVNPIAQQINPSLTWPFPPTHWLYKHKRMGQGHFKRDCGGRQTIIETILSSLNDFNCFPCKLQSSPTTMSGCRLTTTTNYDQFNSTMVCVGLYRRERESLMATASPMDTNENDWRAEDVFVFDYLMGQRFPFVGSVH